MRYIFLLFTFLSLPFSLRKVLVPGLPGGIFNEYRDQSIFLFEVFLLCYIFIYILENKSIILSIYRKQMFHVEHAAVCLLLLALPSIYQSVSFFTFTPLFLFSKVIFYLIFFLFLYSEVLKIVPRGTIILKNNKIKEKLFHVEQLVSKYVPRGTYLTKISIKNCSTWNNLKRLFILTLFLQLFIAFMQLLLQKSLGLVFLGEQILDPKISGVATLIYKNQEVLRAYGTFLHPNIFAGFIVVTLLSYIFLFIVPRGTIIKDFYDWLFIGGSFIGITMTFSKAAVISMILSIIFFQDLLSNCSTWNILSKKYVPRGTYFRKFKEVFCSTWNIILLVSGIILLLFFIIKILNTDYFICQPILERKIQYLSIAKIPAVDILVGLGLGGYVHFLSTFGGYEYWQLQPIHNVVAMAILEIGILPLFFFFLVLPYKKIKVFLCGVSKNRSLALVILVPLLLLDHYFWDTEQGIFLFLSFIFIVFFLPASLVYKKEN